MVPKVAVRITTIPVPTRFSRLTPKSPSSPPPPPQTAQQCSTNNTPPNQIYTTYYRGCILEPPKPPSQKSDKAEKVEPITPERGIHLSPGWERITPAHVSKRTRSSSSSSGTGSSSLESNAAEAKRTDVLPADKRGFILHAWIPVPLSLFENKETCTFRVDARVWVEDSYVRVENSRSLIPKPRRYRQERSGPRWEVGDFSGDSQSSMGHNPDDRMLEASRTVTISHLQRGRDMR